MKASFDAVEKHRVQISAFPPTKHGDRYGMFVFGGGSIQIRAVVDDGTETGWEHVSVSCKQRKPGGKVIDLLPGWSTMSMMKDMFWDGEECVIQFHPPASQYVNRNPYVLHLWRRVGINLETPPTDLV